MAVRVLTYNAAEGDSRVMDARKANDRIAEKAERLHFASRVPMLCECSDRGCHKVMMISLKGYRQIRRDPQNFITAPGHRVEGAELSQAEEAYLVQRAGRSEEQENGGQRSA